MERLPRETPQTDEVVVVGLLSLHFRATSNNLELSYLCFGLSSSRVKVLNSQIMERGNIFPFSLVSLVTSRTFPPTYLDVPHRLSKIYPQLDIHTQKKRTLIIYKWIIYKIKSSWTIDLNISFKMTNLPEESIE